MIAVGLCEDATNRLHTSSRCSSLQSSGAFPGGICHQSQNHETQDKLHGARHPSWLARTPATCPFKPLMRNLETLRVRRAHTHKDPFSGLSCEPRNEGNVLSGLVKSLTYLTACNQDLEELDGMFFEPGDLLKMVETRMRNRSPLTKLHVKCPSLPAAECAALHKALDFSHVRNHEETPPLQQTPYDCAYESAKGDGMYRLLDACED